MAWGPDEQETGRQGCEVATVCSKQCTAGGAGPALSLAFSCKKMPIAMNHTDISGPQRPLTWQRIVFLQRAALRPTPPQSAQPNQALPTWGSNGHASCLARCFFPGFLRFHSLPPSHVLLDDGGAGASRLVSDAARPAAPLRASPPAVRQPSHRNLVISVMGRRRSSIARGVYRLDEVTCLL